MWTAPGLQELWQRVDRIACDHMSGLLIRSGMTADQDGFRDESFKKSCGVVCRWVPRSISVLGSIDHTICSVSSKRRPHMWTAPGLQELWQRVDRIACDHMSGLL